MFSGPEVNPRARFVGGLTGEKKRDDEEERRRAMERRRGWKGLSSPLIRAAIGDREYEIKAHGIAKVIPSKCRGSARRGFG